MNTAEDSQEAFTALSDATRVAILRTLWRAENNEATFSELREAIGMRDSGQFNYHLDRLRGRFVNKTDDGYKLSMAGQLVYGSILSGAYSGEMRIEPVPLSESCPACGGDRTLSYGDDSVTVECNSCDISADAPVPPGVFANYDRDEIPGVADRYFRTIVQQVDNGFCWYCEGQITPRVEPMTGPEDETAENASLPEDSDELPVVQYECARCGIEITVNLGNSMLSHPAVVSFYYDHGINVQEQSIWSFATWNTDRTRITNRDPLQATVTYHADDERLSLVVDETLNVLDVERTTLS